MCNALSSSMWCELAAFLFIIEKNAASVFSYFSCHIKYTLLSRVVSIAFKMGTKELNTWKKKYTVLELIQGYVYVYTHTFTNDDREKKILNIVSSAFFVFHFHRTILARSIHTIHIFTLYMYILCNGGLIPTSP